MVLGRAILWVSAALAGSGMVGYAFGFWEARPTFNAPAIVGTVAIAVAMVAVTVIVRAYLRTRSPQLSLKRKPTGARIRLAWCGIAIFAAINIGAFLGFTIGVRTAQSVTDILAGVGVVAVLVAAAVMLVGIIYTRRSRYKWNRRR